MPLTENGGACRKIARGLGQLAAPGSAAERALLAMVRDELEPEIRKMYATSSDPFGSAWTRDKDGRPAYRSKKMAAAIGIKRVEGGLSVREWVSWIRSADEGHTFPPRQQAEQSRFYGLKGGRIRLGALNRRALRTRFVEERKTAAHQVGERVLPPRRQEPHGRMPEAWGEAVNRGAEKGMISLVGKVTDGAG